MVQERTLATLDMLNAVDWFYAVGEPVTKDVVVVASWDDAYLSNRDPTLIPSSIDAWNLAKQQFADGVYHASHKRYRKWNALVKEIKSVIDPMCSRKANQFLKYVYMTRMISKIQWDVLHIAMAAEYADLYISEFYQELAYWYVNGHYPFAWADGVYPEGRLVIY